MMAKIKGKSLDRRAFLLGSAAVSMLALQGCGAAVSEAAVLPTGSAPAAAPSSIGYERPLHIVYARSGGKAFGDTYSDDDFLKFFDQVPGGVTAAVPFLLNVRDASVYAPMLEKMKAKGIVIVPGVGQKPDNGPINLQKYKDMAKNYRPYTDHIRLENLQGFYDRAGGAAPIQDMIDYLTGTLGFKHIMMNPWPVQEGGVPVPFTNPELDSAIYQVLLKHNRKTHEIIPDPENWFPGNQTKISRVRQYRPAIEILINYESAPQHEVLLQLEQNKRGSSIAAMDITATRIEQGTNNARWCPPFTTIYDPVALGTWDWEAKRLGDF